MQYIFPVNIFHDPQSINHIDDGRKISYTIAGNDDFNVNTTGAQVDISKQLLYELGMITWYRARFAAFLIMVVLCFAIPVLAVYSGVQKQQHIRDQIALHIKNGNEGLEETQLRAISRTLYDASRQHGIDYRLILALMKVESNFQHDAVSAMGARGLLQVKPSLARYMARDMGIEWNGNRTVDDPGNNIKIGIRVLSELVHRFYDLTTALRAYNMGPERTQGLSPEKMTSPKGFPGLVLREYDRNVVILPDP